MSAPISGSENFILDQEEFDKANWSKAKNARFGAASGLEKNSQMFWARLDALEFAKLDTLIEKVLAAHGFEVNLENILYCVENLKIGRKVEWLKNAASQKVKLFESVFAFDLPRKGRNGTLLQRLYGMLDSASGLSETGSKVTPPSLEKILSKKIESLEAKNAELHRELALCGDLQRNEASLRNGLAHAVQEFGASVKSLRSGDALRAQIATENALPEDWKLELCTVSAMDFDHQTASMRVGRKTFSLGFEFLFAAPLVHALGLALIAANELRAVFPLGDKWSAFRYESATVLAHMKTKAGNSAAGKLKLRLGTGSELLYRYTLSEESLQGQNKAVWRLRRHDTVVACFFGDKVFKLHGTPSDPKQHQERELLKLQAAELLQQVFSKQEYELVDLKSVDSR